MDAITESGIKPRFFHLPLERYPSRYTAQLADWEATAFQAVCDENGWLYTPIEADLPPQPIETGVVLDAMQRPRTTLRQLDRLLPQLAAHPEKAVVYMSDMFTPGIEAIPYAFPHAGTRLILGAFCWAQTFDRYDFTTQFDHWMRSYEQMVCGFSDIMFVASEELADRARAALLPGTASSAGWCMVGLPFDATAVRLQMQQCPQAESWQTRQYDVVFTSRMDDEKQPDVFLNLVERCKGMRFALCSGRPLPDNQYTGHARDLAKRGMLDIHENLPKDAYYTVLLNSKVQFNCAKQDWVSYTLLEALCAGCMPLYPMFRSFPAALMYNKAALYPPHVEPATIPAHLRLLLYAGGKDPSAAMIHQFQPTADAILAYHSGTLTRIANRLIKMAS